MTRTGGDALALQLVEEGVSHVFGVPGQQLYHALDGLAKVRDRISYITTRHEQAAGYMADGYARSSGREGVCMVVPGPGLLNTMAALATAYACSSPVLCLVGQIPSHLIGKGTGVLHEVPDQSGLLDSVTKWHVMARSADEIPGLVNEAFRQLRSGRPRPVAVEIPPDVLGQATEVEVIGAISAGSVRTAPDPASIDRAAVLIRQATRPVIYAGWGVQGADASAELINLAESIQAPVVMSRSGMGSIPLRHPLAASKLAGRRLIPEADLVIVVGSRFRSYGGKGGPYGHTAPIVHLDADQATLASRTNDDVCLLGDAKLGLKAVLAAIGDVGPRSSRAQEVATAREWAESEMSAVAPHVAYLRSLRRALPDDAIVASDLTQVAYVARIGFEFLAPRTNLTAGYQGTLGFGYPTVLGAAVGNPDRVAISLSGDGGIGFAIGELATARQYNLPAIAVVFNDSAYKNVQRELAAQFDGRTVGTELTNPDFVVLAAAFGVHGSRTSDPAGLEAAVRSAVASRQPALIEVIVGDMADPWPLLR